MINKRAAMSDNPLASILEMDGESVRINSVLSETQFLFSGSMATKNGQAIVVGEMTCTPTSRF